jgi:hypothetical protein
MALIKSEEMFSGTKPVEPKHRLDEGGLANWMSSNIAGYSSPVRVSQFKGGQSNPTYRLDSPSTSCSSAEASGETSSFCTCG